MVKGRIEFSISFLEPGGNYVLNGNVQLLCCINSNCVFSKTIPLWGQFSQPVSQPTGFLYRFISEPKNVNFIQRTRVHIGIDVLINGRP